MASVRKWSNVAVNMESAIGAAVTITGITKAAPGVVSAAAHGFVNGDYVLLKVQGMYQVTDKIFRVVQQTAGTFQLEAVSGGTGIDTTAYDTFGSGTAQKITFGTSITTITEVSSNDGGTNFIDTTTIHVGQKTQIPGLPEALSYTFNNLWDIADSGQQAMKIASDGQQQKAFKFVFGTGGVIMVFTGYVSFSGTPAGSAQDKVTSSATITAFGTPSFYSA